MKRKKTRTAVVTGACGYLGKLALKEYKRQGYFVIGIDLEETAPQMNRMLKSGSLDGFCLGDLASPSFALEVQKSHLYRRKVSVLVNCVGGGKVGPATLEGFEALTYSININLYTIWHACALFIPRMKANGSGKIVNFASIFSVKPFPNTPAYSAAKAAVAGFTRSIAVDCAPHNILVNSISPGHIKDSPRHNWFFQMKAGQDFIEKHVALKRLCNVEEIIKMMIFMTADENRSMTGQNVVIDSGTTL